MVGPEIFSTVIDGYLPQPHAALLNGIVFGIPLGKYGDFHTKLKMVGLLHLVVLSGMNITILAGIITAITIPFGRKLSLLITALLIGIFVCFVGLQAPAVRAGFCAILTVVSIASGRKAIPFYLLILSGIFIAIFFPKWVTGLSFQLSYGATLGIILFGPKIQDRHTGLAKNIASQIKQELHVTLAAQVFTAPLIFIHFKQISLISPLANIMVVFLIAPLMIVGMITAVLGKISHTLGLLPSIISYGILNYLLFVIDILSEVPLGYLSF